MTAPDAADATQDDDKIEATDNSAEEGQPEVSQDPNWVPDGEVGEVEYADGSRSVGVIEDRSCGVVAIDDSPCQLSVGHEGAHRWQDPAGVAGFSWHNGEAPEVTVSPNAAPPRAVDTDIIETR